MKEERAKGVGNKAEMIGWVRSWQTLESKRRKDFPGRGNKGPETARNLTHSRKARNVARQETRGRVAAARRRGLRS